MPSTAVTPKQANAVTLDLVPFMRTANEIYKQGNAHVFTLHGNTNDYQDNHGRLANLRQLMMASCDDHYTAELLEKKGISVQAADAAQRGTHKAETKEKPKRICAIYVANEGLKFDSDKSRELFISILSKEYEKEIKAQKVRPDFLTPFSFEAVLFTLSKWFEASKSIRQYNRQALRGGTTLKPEAMLTMIFSDCDGFFPAGAIASLNSDRLPIIFMRNWAKDKEIGNTNRIFLVTRHLSDIHESLRGGASGISAILVPKPSFDDREEFSRNFCENLAKRCHAMKLAGDPLIVEGQEVTGVQFAADFDHRGVAVQGAGMSRDQIEKAFNVAISKRLKVDDRIIREIKQKCLEEEYDGLIEFEHPEFGFDRVGGLEELKLYAQRKIITPLKAGDARTCSRGVLLTGPAGCQPAGSKVLMADGTWNTVENVVVGDKVVSPQHDGSSLVATVTETVVYKNHDIYQVATNGRSVKKYKCADNHIVPFLRLTRPRKNGVRQPRHYVLEERQAQEVVGLGKDACAVVFSTTAVEFPQEQYTVHPYIVGAVSGDGSVSRSFDPAFVNADTAVWDRMADCGAEFGDLMEDGITRYFVGGSAKSIKDLGLCGHKAATKRIPEQYKRGTIAQRLEVLAGLIDTDGSIDSFSSKSKGLAEDFVDLVHSVGGFANAKSRWTTCNGKRFLSYRVHYAFAEYAPVLSMQHKARKPRDLSWKNPRRRSFTIRKVGVGDVFGFVLDSPSEWYVTDGWMVTHNTGKTWFARSLAYMAGVNFLKINLSKLMNRYVGGTEELTAKLIEAIWNAAPCIPFIDEIDSALGGGRVTQGDSNTGGRVFSSMMTFLSDDSRAGKIVVLAATNRPEVLDAALIRDGRFDALLPVLPPPESGQAAVDGRANILQALVRKHGVKFGDGVKDTMKDPMTGLGKLLRDENHIWTGAEIESLLKDAIENALWAKSSTIEVDHWNEAMDNFIPMTQDVEKMTNWALYYCNKLSYIPVEWREKARDKAALMHVIRGGQDYRA